MIPLDRIATNDAELDYFYGEAISRRRDSSKPFPETLEFTKNFRGFFKGLKISEPYQGTKRQRQSLYEFTSTRIDHFVRNTKLISPGATDGEGLEIPPELREQVELLKELTWCYVINNPALAAQQHGQRKAIRTLFEVFDEAAERGNWALFPPFFRDEGQKLAQETDWSALRRARLVADTIASMTDQQALRMFHRLTGTSQGSVLDPIVS